MGKESLLGQVRYLAYLLLAAGLGGDHAVCFQAHHKTHLLVSKEF